MLQTLHCKITLRRPPFLWVHTSSKQGMCMFVNKLQFISKVVFVLLLFRRRRTSFLCSLSSRKAKSVSDLMTQDEFQKNSLMKVPVRKIARTVLYLLLLIKKHFMRAIIQCRFTHSLATFCFSHYDDSCVNLLITSFFVTDKYRCPLKS